MMYTGRKRPGTGLVFCGIGLLLAAVLVKLFAYGFAFTAAILFGVGLVLLLYALLGRLSSGQKGRNSAVWARRVLTGLLIVGTIGFVLSEGVIVSNARSDENAAADYVIVLGAGVRGEELSLVLQSRLKTASDYLKQHPQAVVVVSGGRGAGEAMTEAEAMDRYLRASGIDESRIMKEERSTNTAENMTYSKAVLQSAGWDAGSPVAVVTSEFHLWRAGFLAEKNGITPLKVAAATPILPLRINFFVREAFALVKTVIFDR